MKFQENNFFFKYIKILFYFLMRNILREKVKLKFYQKRKKLLFKTDQKNTSENYYLKID